jgi:hypothetical protein
MGMFAPTITAMRTRIKDLAIALIGPGYQMVRIYTLACSSFF